tara:strand:+ start:1149 stop:1658 length:510 start_codon:yes stop_codon:yes gene_type:complete
MKLKTQFCERFFNLSPRIVIYDLDGTIIDSSHRIKLLENGSLDLEHWKQNSTKEQIFKDDLLPLYWQLVADYKHGNFVVLCTARELGKYDYEFIHSMGIYYDKIISRPHGNTMVDHILKKNQLRYFWNLKPFKNIHKSFYDDNLNNLLAISELGIGNVFHAKDWNDNYS